MSERTLKIEAGYRNNPLEGEPPEEEHGRPAPLSAPRGAVPYARSLREEELLLQVEQLQALNAKLVFAYEARQEGVDRARRDGERDISFGFILFAAAGGSSVAMVVTEIINYLLHR